MFGALGGAITAEIGPFGNGSSYSISDDSYVDSFGYDGEGDSYDADDTDSLSVNDESAAYDSEGDADGYTEPTHNSSGDNQYAAAIASSLTEDEFMNVSQSQAECFGQGTVGIIGLQQLEQSSLTALDLELFPFDYQALGLSQSQGLEIYDQFRSCDIDIHAALKEGASAVTEMYAALLPGLADTTSFRSCMTDIFDDRTLMRNYMAQIMTRGQEAAMNDRSAGSLAAAVNERC